MPVGGHQFSLFVRAKRCFLNPVKNQSLCLSIPHLFQTATSSKNLPPARLIPLLVPVGGHQFSLFVRAKRCFLNPVKNQSLCLSIPDLFAKNHSLVPAKRRFLNPIKNQTLCLSIPHLFQAATSSKNLPSARLIPLLVPVGGHQFSLFVRAKRCFLNPVKNQSLCLSIPDLFAKNHSLVPAKRRFLNPIKNQTLCLSIPHLFQAATSSKNLPSARLIPLLVPVGGHQFSLFVRAKRCFLNPVKNQSLCLSIPDLFAKNHSLVPAKRRFLNPIKNQTLCLSIPHLFQAATSSKNLPSARLIPLLVPVGGHQFSLFVRAKRCFLNPVTNQSLCLSIPDLFAKNHSLVPAKRRFLNPIKNQTLCLSIPHLFQAATSSKNLPSARLIPLLVPVGGHQFSLFVRAKRCFLNPVTNQSLCLSIPDLFAKNHSLVPAKRRFLNPIKNQTLCLSIPHLFQAATSSKNLPSARLIPLLVPVGGHQFSLFVRAKRCFLNPVKNQSLCLSIPHLFQTATSSKNLPPARLIPLLVPVGGHQFSLFVRAKRCFLNPVKNKSLCLSIPDLFAKNHSLVPAKRRFLNPIKNQTLCLSIPHLFQAATSSKNLPSARLIPLLVPVGGHQFSLFVRAKRCFLNPVKNQSLCLSIPDLFAKNHSLVPAKRRFLNPIKNQTLCLSIPHLFQAATSSKNLPSARLIPLLVPVGGHQFSLFVRAKRCFLNLDPSKKSVSLSLDP